MGSVQQDNVGIFYSLEFPYSDRIAHHPNRTVAENHSRIEDRQTTGHTGTRYSGDSPSVV
jgi:hypothetical protein